VWNNQPSDLCGGCCGCCEWLPWLAAINHTSLFSRTLSSVDNDPAGFWGPFFNSLSMIMVTEIGDKTFFIAAVMAMRYDRSVVFSGAIGK